tara:strand:- start:150 stop:833 length:684 start_codon:yes stop_codon:yes gene_type:complete
LSKKARAPSTPSLYKGIGGRQAAQNLDSHVNATTEIAEAAHTLAVLVDDEPGVLARVIGLFSGRGYNIESLTVSSVDTAAHLSRITIVTTGTPQIIAQIKAQLGRLVPVHSVHDLTLEGPHLERELALIKIRNVGEHRIEALRIADMFRARAIDSTLESFVFELTGSPSKITAFVELMSALGAIEVSRTGVVAIARGSNLDMPVFSTLEVNRKKAKQPAGKKAQKKA